MPRPLELFFEYGPAGKNYVHLSIPNEHLTNRDSAVKWKNGLSDAIVKANVHPSFFNVDSDTQHEILKSLRGQLKIRFDHYEGRTSGIRIRIHVEPKHIGDDPHVFLDRLESHLATHCLIGGQSLHARMGTALNGDG